MPNPPYVDTRVARAKADVQKYGWHVVKVLANESSPCFAYSIGFFETFQHSEVLMVGFDLDLMHTIINNIGHDIRSGRRFDPDQQSDKVLDDFKVAFKPVLPRFFDQLVGTAQDYYGHRLFSVLQCVLPDKTHRFPWEPGCNEWLKENQWTFFEE